MFSAEWQTLLQLGLVIAITWLVLVPLYLRYRFTPPHVRRYRPKQHRSAHRTAPTSLAQSTPE